MDILIAHLVVRLKNRNWLDLSTKEIALISVLSAVWIGSQFYLGPIIGQMTQMHGMVNRLVGWLLMLVLAEQTGKFGRVSTMAAIASLVTRIVGSQRTSPLETFFVGLGYALGGLTFDLLFFFPFTNSFQGRMRNSYLLAIAVFSGTIAAVPYLLSKVYFLGVYGFTLWFPLNSYRVAKDIILSVLGVSIGLSTLPRLNIWRLKTSK